VKLKLQIETCGFNLQSIPSTFLSRPEVESQESQQNKSIPAIVLFYCFLFVYSFLSSLNQNTTRNRCTVKFSNEHTKWIVFFYQIELIENKKFSTETPSTFVK